MITRIYYINSRIGIRCLNYQNNFKHKEPLVLQPYFTFIRNINHVDCLDMTHSLIEFPDDGLERLEVRSLHRVLRPAPPDDDSKFVTRTVALLERRPEVRLDSVLHFFVNLCIKTTSSHTDHIMDDVRAEFAEVTKNIRRQMLITVQTQRWQILWCRSLLTRNNPHQVQIFKSNVYK